MVEQEIRGRLGSLRRREELLQLVNEKFGTMLDVGPTKAVITQDPEEEMEALTSMYLVSTARGERTQQRTGRMAIVHSMIEAFANAGVLELMQRDLDVMQYTGLGDPFRIDFGYRSGAREDVPRVSVAANLDQALAVAYRYSRIEAGMRRGALTGFVDGGGRPGDGVTGGKNAVRGWDAEARFRAGEKSGGNGGHRSRGETGSAFVNWGVGSSIRSEVR